MNHKDLLGVIFLEIENGHDMINFSEISRRCHQIFHQYIKIEDREYWKQMKNIHGQLHGICRGWHTNGQLQYEWNYLHGQKHGILRGWYQNGQLMGNFAMNIITFKAKNMESGVGGTRMDNFAMKIITIKAKNMESAVCGIKMGNLSMIIITIMTKKLKNKMLGPIFFV